MEDSNFRDFWQKKNEEIQYKEKQERAETAMRNKEL